MGKPWFRFYSGILRDRKIEHICNSTGQLRTVVVGIWATLLSLANDSPRLDGLFITNDIPLTLFDILDEIGLGEDIGRAVLEEFLRFNMLSNTDTGYRVTHWPQTAIRPHAVPEYSPCVYIIGDETQELYKIGKTCNPGKRIKELCSQGPLLAQEIHIIPADNAYEAEAVLHSWFDTKRVHGEWFRLHPDEVIYLKSLKEFRDGQFFEGSAK